jgi:hypothetical protein
VNNPASKRSAIEAGARVLAQLTLPNFFKLAKKKTAAAGKDIPRSL